MSLYAVPNMSLGMDQALVDLATNTGGTAATGPPIVPMMLIFVFAMVFLGGAINQKRRQGVADLPMWAAVASIATTMIATGFALVPGIISPILLSLTIAVTFVTGLWLFLTRNRNEI